VSSVLTVTSYTANSRGCPRIDACGRASWHLSGVQAARDDVTVDTLVRIPNFDFCFDLTIDLPLLLLLLLRARARSRAVDRNIDDNWRVNRHDGRCFIASPLTVLLYPTAVFERPMT
jgi:hypothetical protein